MTEQAAPTCAYPVDAEPPDDPYVCGKPATHLLPATPLTGIAMYLCKKHATNGTYTGAEPLANK